MGNEISGRDEELEPAQGEGKPWQLVESPFEIAPEPPPIHPEELSVSSPAEAVAAAPAPVQTKETPKPTGDEGTEPLGRIIHIVCIAISLGLALCLIHPFLTREIPTAAVLIAEELALVVVLLLNGRGSSKSALSLLAVSLLGTIMALIFFRGNGIHDIAIMAFPAVVVVSSLLLSKRWFVSLTLACMLCISFLWAMESRRLPVAEGESASLSLAESLVTPHKLLLVEWAEAVGILGLTALLVGLITSHLRQNLLRSRSHESSLAQNNTELQRQTDYLKNYREILDGISEAVLVAEVSKGLVVESNRAAAELFGFDREELSGMTLAAFCTGQTPLPDDKAAEWTVKAISQGVHEFKTQCWHRSGNSFLAEVELRGTKIGGEDRLLAVIRDHTVHEKAELELRESEARFFSLSQASFEGVAIVDDGVVVAANDNYTAMHGYECEEVIGMKVSDLMPEEQGGFLFESDPTGKEALYETEAVRKDGSRFPIEIRGKFMPFNGRTARVAAIRDISERRSLQEQIRQAQKMEAFGQLAGGVAHDFNNLLTVIIAHAGILKMSCAALGLEEQGQSVEEISEAADRATNLTRQLLTFSRRQQMQRSRVDLNEVVRNMTKMLKRILGEQIALQANCTEGYVPVYADSGMLEQVLLNLAVNSRDAMPNGGYLIIQTDLVSVSPEDLAKHPGSPEGNYARMAVTDTGAGIAPENLARIFEPFFTTKGVGKGTGLGLATVFGIVEQHQGWVEVQSRVGAGTTFQIFLPQGSGNMRKLAKKKDGAMQGGNETILLAEDEDGVRELTKMVLQASGYQVLEASNAYAAFDIWKANSSEIDMLFTDLVMPGDVGGRKLAEQMLIDKPDLKVIYCSGYTDETLGEDAFLREAPNFLQKPFDLVRLSQVVRATLDGVPLDSSQEETEATE